MDDTEFDAELEPEEPEASEAGEPDADDFDASLDAVRHPAPPVRRFASSAAGSSLAAAMMGLAQVLEPSKKEIPAIVVEHDGQGEPFNEPIVLRLDPDNPADSIVLVRKHLLDPGE